ncbi:hypothetical protein FRC10_000978 [Ceratobasidium sp. 414]|nr:hypothetical protein FRC10_000978 [Ceratobasidium sp. 414]
MSGDHCFAWTVSRHDLEGTAKAYNLSYAGLTTAHMSMSREAFERLESYGPLRLELALINGSYGYLFVVGHDNCELLDIDSNQLECLAETFHCGPQRFVAEPVKAGMNGSERYVAKQRDGTPTDFLYRLGVIRCAHC